MHTEPVKTAAHAVAATAAGLALLGLFAAYCRTQDCLESALHRRRAHVVGVSGVAGV